MYKEMAEEAIKKYMPHEKEYQEKVIDAMNYAVDAGGKRVRPVLMLLTYKMLGGDEKIIEPFMAAIEMIHTYSLIHDDLPALDNDYLRRGRPTVHVAFGEDIAILAGDALLNYAYETAAKAFSMSPGDIRVENAYTVLAKRPGIYGMIGGQTADVVLTGKKPDKSELMYIYENKTAALIECAMEIGACLAGADKVKTENIRSAAGHIGMAFQVQDDILDMTGDEEIIGKPVGSDEKNQKYTYATMYGIENAHEYVKEQSEKAISMIKAVVTEENEHCRNLLAIIESLAKRDK